MNYDFNTNHFDVPQRAYEIELRARKMEKQYALMNYLNRSHVARSGNGNLSRAFKTIGTYIASLFM